MALRAVKVKLGKLTSPATNSCRENSLHHGLSLCVYWLSKPQICMKLSASVGVRCAPGAAASRRAAASERKVARYDCSKPLRSGAEGQLLSSRAARWRRNEQSASERGGREGRTVVALRTTRQGQEGTQTAASEGRTPEALLSTSTVEACFSPSCWKKPAVQLPAAASRRSSSAPNRRPAGQRATTHSQRRAVDCQSGQREASRCGSPVPCSACTPRLPPRATAALRVA